jgi:hypothetical protein
MCVKLVIYKDYTELHGQQNIKFWITNCKVIYYDLVFWSGTRASGGFHWLFVKPGHHLANNCNLKHLYRYV